MKNVPGRAIHASLLALILTSAEAGQTVFHFTSEPGDFIGQGQELTLTSADADFIVNRNFANGVSVFINNFSFPNPPSFVFWSADFAAPFGADLMPGAYEGATRFPFNDPSEPGLSISGDGRGCNMLTGRFDIREAVYDSFNGEVISFAADFEQHCEGAPPALFGSIRINSDIPLPVLLPPRIDIDNALNSQGCIEATDPSGATVNLSAAVPVPGDFVFDWSTSTGEIGTGPTFSFLLGVDAIADVFLTATDISTSEQATATAQICVSDTTPPQITIHSPTEGQVFFGRNAMLDVSIVDDVDQQFDHVRVFTGHVANIPVNANQTGVRAKLPPAKTDPDGTTLTEITVEATDDSGNTGQASVNIRYQHDGRR